MSKLAIRPPPFDSSHPCCQAQRWSSRLCTVSGVYMGSLGGERIDKPNIWFTVARTYVWIESLEGSISMLHILVKKFAGNSSPNCKMAALMKPSVPGCSPPLAGRHLAKKFFAESLPHSKFYLRIGFVHNGSVDKKICTWLNLPVSCCDTSCKADSWLTFCRCLGRCVQENSRCC